MSSLNEKADVLTSGATGVRFEPLVLFAEPLFDHYHLDATSAFELAYVQGEPDPTVVTALEAARVIWAYLSLEPQTRDQAHRALADYMLGPNHAPEDEVDLEFLLERMEDQWNLLTHEDRSVAEGGEHPTLGFEELLRHPAFVHPDDESAAGYGPDGLSEVEAQALFAQPLLDGAEDPEAMEHALDRAHAYWELALLPAESRTEEIANLVREMAQSQKERTQVEDEVHAMIERFNELFPERAR